MAKPLKEAGISEIEQFEKRVRRQHTLGRISSGNSRALLRMTSMMKNYVNEMEEDK